MNISYININESCKMKLPKETITNFKLLVKLCQEICPDCIFALVDTEGNEVWCNLTDTLLEELQGGDEEQTLEVWDSNRLNKLTWFGIMPYEPDGVCWNYCANELGNKIFRKFFERIEGE